jgi:allophanate hydrolase
LPETVAEIVSAHRRGTIKPEETVARSFDRIRAHGDPAIFITLCTEDQALAEARDLSVGGNKELPLFGIPFAVKDNIDVRGMPTTAGCPAFTYYPHHDAGAVSRLRASGAIVIGKTNLDQFATGLVGVRSPYGVPRNPFDPKIIPGGSSSGSAIAVAAGLVPLALGTDTAGSGRVPAGLNNIVGLKPSIGLVSTTGVVPACRTLDCVSVLALTVDDAFSALQIMAGFDSADPFSRSRSLGKLGALPPALNLAVPLRGQRLFFGDQQSAHAYETAIARIAKPGIAVAEIDIEPLYEAARLLYEGPWLAERYITTRSLLASAHEMMHPVTRSILIEGARPSAAEAFASFYKLEELRRACDRLFRDIDALIVPTVPTVYTVEQVFANPIELNSRLGTYTNFVNLLDLCGLAVPVLMRADGTPFGVTLLAPAGQDAALASLGRVVHADSGLPLGALDCAQPPLSELHPVPAAGEIALAVVGAHLSGMPLNGEIRNLGGRLLETRKTSRDYRLYALADTEPRKPGLIRTGNGDGGAIELEVWALPVESFGRFVAGVPAPLSIGNVTLDDGRTVKGFLVEPRGIAGAEDITSFGGWRAFLGSLRA